MKLDFDVVVVGAGVAGMTAAIYLKRGNANVCIAEKGTPGGLINLSSDIENYPGIKKTAGVDLAFSMYEQVMSLNIPFRSTEIKEIKSLEDKKVLVTTDGEITCQSIILCMGRGPIKLELDNVDRLTGRGISYCAVCDGALYKDKDVCVVGVGNSALEESLYLANLCRKVYIIHRRDVLRGEKMLVSKIKEKDNIEVIYNAQIIKFNEENDRLSSIDIDEEGSIRNIAVSGCFTFIGYKPANELVKNFDILDEKGYIIVDKGMQTNIKGIYAAGDIVYKDAFQIVTAASDGALAAISCMRSLK